MPGGNDDSQPSDLTDVVRRLTMATERIAESLVRIEAQYAETTRKQDEDRAEARERQRQFDAEQEGFKERQKRWDERDKKWEEEGLTRNPWLWPGQIANLLLMLALGALAITVLILVKR